MDSFHSNSSKSLSESWDCTPAERKHLIPYSTVNAPRRSSLRLAKKRIETGRESMQQANQVLDSIVIYSCRASSRSTKKLTETRTSSVQAHQVVQPSTFAQTITHEETEKVGDFVAPNNGSVEMEIVSEDENPIASDSIQMEGHDNAFEAECILIEDEALAENVQVQASSNSKPRQREDKNTSESNSMVGHQSSLFSLDLTKMVNMWDNEGDDEVNSIGQSSPMETVEGYQVKPEYVPILRKVFTKYGDVFKNSLVSTMTFRSMLLEMICHMISDLLDKNLDRISENELHNMIALANEIKNMKVNIEWLHIRLEEILEARQNLKQSGKLKEKKDSNKKVIETVKRELEECEAKKKALTAMLQSICDKETACKETLAIAEDESIKIDETVTYAKTKVRRFFKCSLVDGLL